VYGVRSRRGGARRWAARTSCADAAQQVPTHHRRHGLSKEERMIKPTVILVALVAVLSMASAADAQELKLRLISRALQRGRRRS
jgi:hypothetical protein